MESESYTFHKIQKMFDIEKDRKTIAAAEGKGIIPEAIRSAGGHRRWLLADLPLLGAHYGYLKPLRKPKVIVVYSQKGGALKTTLSLNVSRIAALHNIKTLVVGLDTQADITQSLGHDHGIDDNMTLEEALSIIKEDYALPDLLDADKNEINLDDLIQNTDIPSLDYIPETLELDYLEQQLVFRQRRETWLLENVITPLKNTYDLFVIDLGPAWNLLTINALFSADMLLSPLECKINHFRNLKYFKLKIQKFKQDAKKDFNHIYIPVKTNDAKKLCKQIKKHYISTLEDCTTTGLRISSSGEDSMVHGKSVTEHAPSSPLSQEMKEIMKQIWSDLQPEAVYDEISLQSSTAIERSNSSLSV